MTEPMTTAPDDPNLDDANPSLFPWPDKRPEYASLSAAVQGETSRWNAVGMAAGIIHNEHEEIAVTGCSNIVTGAPIHRDALFLIGSISKIYTATVAMILVERGDLDLDEPIVTYLPDLGLASDSARARMTMRHLLSHSSGFEGDRFIDYGRGDDSLTRCVSEFDSLTQWFAPGSMYSYNNAGFYLAGRIIEVVAGEPFEAAMKTLLLDPLQLTHTELLPEMVLNHPFAVGHSVDRRSGVSISVPQHLPRNVHAAGGIIQSIGDLLRFARMHLNGGELDGVRVLSEESVNAMQQPVVEADTFYRHYGIGWSISQRPECTVIGHSGAWSGHRANLTLIPEQQFACAQLTNSNVGASAYDGVEEWSRKHTLGISWSSPDRVLMSEATRADFEGTYSRHDGEFVVSMRGDGLRITLTDIDEETSERGERPRLFDLEPVGETRFRVTSAESRGSTVDILTAADADGEPQTLLRLWGRVAKKQ